MPIFYQRPTLTQSMAHRTETPLRANTPSVIVNLWPGLAPGETTASTGKSVEDATGLYGKITKLSVITSPQMLLYPVDETKRVRPTVLVFPGGGYYLLAADIEGTEIAHWLNSLGYNAVILHYRVPNWQVPSPNRREPAFQDAQRAMVLLRANATAWGINPHQLGVIGFSAGGHLAARLACADANADWKPDFALLIYPAYLWDKQTGHPAPEVQPHPNMPPVFLTQTRDDGLFDVEPYAAALKQADVSVQCEIYTHGGHGYGLRLSPHLPAHQWPDKAAIWLRQQNKEGNAHF